jgi:hypothetical protein
MSDETKIVICYSIDKENGCTVDINIADYEEDTIKDLATLLASIPSMQFQVQTMSIVKEAFLNDGKRRELESLITSVLDKSEDLLLKMSKNNDEDSNEKGKGEPNEPCIKPSDIL